MKRNVRIIPVKFELGKIYNVSFNHAKTYTVKCIQVTPKGFNFLNEKTNKCLFRTHFYQSRKLMESKNESMWFYRTEITTFKEKE